MRFSTRLDSAVFQLTPTRTRCDLVIFANGKTEKIASGLLEPFLAHLRIAQDQMAKGGYSITLEPEHGSDATWFTKGTLERFIRFVNTPEVLERAYTLESEILQIEEAIAIQGKYDIGLSSVDDHHQEKFVDGSEGRRPIDYNEEKAIVLYQQGAHPPEETGSAMQEGNSKIHLLKVLETRRILLQKEQGMAFARAVAAGFDMDHMAPIICFAENFGASRLMDACMKFVELWKRKHETGQWLDIEAAGAMSVQSDISPIKAPGTIEFKEASNRISEINGKASINMSTDQKPSLDHPPSLAQHEYFQGQFPHHMYAPWAVHPSPGTMPVFQPYPMQGMPYYPNYQGNSPYFQPPHQGTEDPRQNSSEKIDRRHSMDNTNNELGAWEKGVSQDDIDLDKGASASRETGKRTSRSGRKQSGTVVIRNINYITSKGKESSGDESESTSGSGTEEDGRALWSTKREGSHAKHADTKEGDGGHWQAFQNHLLRDVDEGEHETNQNLFSMEKDVRPRKQDRAGDPLAFDERDLGEYEAADKIDMHNLSGKSSHVRRANEEPLISSKLGYSGSIGTTNADIGPHSTELDRRMGLYRNSTNDDFMLHKRATQQDNRGSPFDPNVKGFEPPMSSQNMDDDSYVVSLRSNSSDQIGSNDRNTRVMDSELPSARQRAESSSSRIENRVSYEPDGLTLIPERRLLKGSNGYDPALDYDMHIQPNVGGASLDKKNNAALVDSKRSSKKSDDNRKSKIGADSLDKKKTLAPSRRVKPGKPSPLEEARARAERLRTFKADLQKIKKEKEDEQLKRLEALKIERQKRIAARSGSIPVQSPSQQKITQFPIKLSPSSHKGSKFSDSDPGPASPLQRYSVRTTPAKSNDLQKASKSNKLSRSASSLPEKNESSGVTPDTKSSMARTRRLSEPKLSTSRLQDSSVKPRGTRPSPSAKPRVSDGHESKNISSAKPRVSDGHERKNISSAKPRVSDGHESKNISSAKPRVSDGRESKNISSIVNHDKNMSASLPELKIKMAKVPDNQGKSSTKELLQNLKDNKASPKWNFDNSSHTDRDDNPIIEKTVVMLEKPSNTVVQASQGQRGTISYGRIEDTTEPELLSDYTAIRAPVSPLTMDGGDNSHVGHEVQIRASDFEARTANLTHAENKPSTRPVLGGNPYQAPYAQVSVLEDSFTGSSENGRELPTNVQLPTSNGSIKVNISDSPTAKQETNKNESKGIRRLLKFGRKTHVATGGQHNSESDNRGLSGLEANDISANSSTSNEVHTLKNLLSQDDTPTSSTSQKPARHFSLLSPFRNKTSEKKLTT